VESPSSAKIPPLADTPIALSYNEGFRFYSLQPFSRHEAGVMEKWPVGLSERKRLALRRCDVATVGVNHVRRMPPIGFGYEAKI
jgi:hypothetical protein